MTAPSLSKVHNILLPGVEARRCTSQGAELERHEVYLNGEFVGCVVYVSRRVPEGTEYGWRPATSHGNVKLTSRVEAIRDGLLGS